ncbi:TRAP-type mannitol/chloroaromatic compound transport system, small permease component [Cribrihabitans marinus]|uniref:TRAP transporter small permease protein n=1 Tax=Cribrihabitans marinus TaxID=1227549 RepID=A0A1H6Z387_9RHOB|nr:TRAP transporter small permease subunit [Cribrihabitans marinus]GGH31398.1 C4-dicarboxylate ABC transporter permease [Cribrihabitans marinus]SEJ48053.1 TRAP-type mannitol/chloroaromatic compound transport system, small permease component [Cribrihabitans marinus]
MAQKLLGTLRGLNKLVAILIGIVLLACAAIVLADIVLRQLGSSLGGTDEISGYVMAIATSWGMGYTLLELGHVRIDILRGRTGNVGRAVFDLFAMAVLSGTVTLIALQSWPVLARSLANGSRANTPLETPLALVQTPWFAGWIWFAAVAWLTFAAALILVLRGEFRQSEEAIGCFGEEETAR